MAAPVGWRAPNGTVYEQLSFGFRAGGIGFGFQPCKLFARRFWKIPGSLSASPFLVRFSKRSAEGVPFILIGTLLSGIIDEFLPSRVMVRLLPRNAFLGICLSGAMGLVFPMCECGVVPVIRRLISKGLPVSNAIAYMLAAPIVNPIVILSTYAAFRGQNAAEFTSLRVGVGYLVSVIVALAVHNLPLHAVLRAGIFSQGSTTHGAGHSHGFLSTPHWRRVAGGCGRFP